MAFRPFSLNPLISWLNLEKNLSNVSKKLSSDLKRFIYSLSKFVYPFLSSSSLIFFSALLTPVLRLENLVPTIQNVSVNLLINLPAFFNSTKNALGDRFVSSPLSRSANSTSICFMLLPIIVLKKKK